MVHSPSLKYYCCVCVCVLGFNCSCPLLLPEQRGESAQTFVFMFLELSSPLPIKLNLTLTCKGPKRTEEDVEECVPQALRGAGLQDARHVIQPERHRKLPRSPSAQLPSAVHPADRDHGALTGGPLVPRGSTAEDHGFT